MTQKDLLSYPSNHNTVGYASAFHLSHKTTTFTPCQASSTIFGEQDETASATVRKILSSPTKFANVEAWSLLITTGPGFARMS